MWNDQNTFGRALENYETFQMDSNVYKGIMLKISQISDQIWFIKLYKYHSNKFLIEEP